MIKLKEGFSGERAIVLPDSVVRDMERHPLSAALHITDMGYYPQALHHYRERREPITQNILIYCTAGRGWFETDGRRHAVEHDQCFVLPAGVPHRYGADEAEPWSIYWIHFKGTLAQSYAERLPVPTRIAPSEDSRISERLELFEEIYRILETGYSKDNLLYACTALHHFLGTVCYVQAYRQVKGAPRPDNIVETTLHFMKENIEKKLTVQELATHVGYSVSHFTGIFRKATGYPPIDYYNRLKIQHACHLLDFTDMHINQVCHKSGIPDCYYFTRVFTKIMGVSPKEYRLMQKG